MNLRAVKTVLWTLDTCIELVWRHLIYKYGNCQVIVRFSSPIRLSMQSLMNSTRAILLTSLNRWKDPFAEPLNYLVLCDASRNYTSVIWTVYWPMFVGSKPMTIVDDIFLLDGIAISSTVEQRTTAVSIYTQCSSNYRRRRWKVQNMSRRWVVGVLDMSISSFRKPSWLASGERVKSSIKTCCTYTWYYGWTDRFILRTSSSIKTTIIILPLTFSTHTYSAS